MTDALPPWLEPAWQRFSTSVAGSRLPHALLIAGPEGIGKRALANAMAASLLCEIAGAQTACGTCRGCQLFIAGSHPDFLHVAPESGGSGILKIEGIRDLTAFSQLTSQYKSHRVAVIAPAEAMNRNAANALLKTLEEPPAEMVVILVSDAPAQLPATIRSRCQHYRLGMPSSAGALEWLGEQGVEPSQAALSLAVAGGAPLRAVQIHQQAGVAHWQALVADIVAVASGQRSAVAAAADWQESGAGLVNEYMQRLIALLRRHQYAPVNQSLADEAFNQLAKNLSAEYLDRVYRSLTELRAATSPGLAKELSLEAHFLLWSPA